MKAYSGSLFLLLLLIFACSARAEKPAISKARKLHEYKQHSLGLMDISSDGRFLLMHQKLRDVDRVKSMDNHKLRVIEVSSQKEKAAIELQSSEAYMLFRPGSHQVLLNGQLNEPAETGCFLWDIDSGTVRKNETLTQKKLSFPQFVGPDQLAGSVSGDGHYVVYDFRHDSFAPLDVTRGERLLFRWDPGLIFATDFKTLVGQSYSKPILTLREWGTSLPERQVEISVGYPRRCTYSPIYSPDGRYLIVVSTSTQTESRPAKILESYLSVYDAKTLQVKRSQRILTQEVGESWMLNVGFQIALSPNGRWLVMGYDRYSEKLLRLISYLQATYAVFEFPSLNQVAYAEQTQIRTSYEWAEVSPAQSGRLRFDADSGGFYTTSKYTIHWALPE
jgi:WD40-like Beta Propeller Repeat